MIVVRVDCPVGKQKLDKTLKTAYRRRRRGGGGGGTSSGGLRTFVTLRLVSALLDLLFLPKLPLTVSVFAFGSFVVGGTSITVTSFFLVRLFRFPWIFHVWLLHARVCNH